MKIRDYRLYGRIVAFNTSFDSSGTLRTQPDVNGYKLLKGTGFTEASQYRNVCLVDAHLSEYWMLEENDFIAVGEDSVAFQIQGSIASPEYLLNMGSYADIMPSPRRFGVIFVPLGSAQHLLDVPSKINEISVKTQHGLSQSSRQALAKELKTYLEAEPCSLKMGEPVDLDYQMSYYLLRLDAEEGREFGIVLPIIFLGMAMAGLYVLLGRMVVAERKEIGVSQALGYSRRHIIAHYVGIAMVIAVLGTIVGTILGILFAQQFSIIYVGVIGIKFPAYTPIEWIVVFAGVIFGLLTGLVG
ncbi:MAG: ABC transporter permease, partial [Candidatus Hodarchaeota archaeon]